VNSIARLVVDSLTGVNRGPIYSVCSFYRRKNDSFFYMQQFCVDRVKYKFVKVNGI